MLLPWRRKRSQFPRASAAVHALHCFHAEPKRPAPFTYLQFHAQVVHFVLSRRSSPPAASVFFSDRMGSPGCYEVSSPSPQSSHRPCRFSSGACLSFSLRCSTLGKIKSTLHPLHPWFSMQSPSIILHQEASPSLQNPSMESLKVIALDKFAVNTNLSSGNSIS